MFISPHFKLASLQPRLCEWVPRQDFFKFAVEMNIIVAGVVVVVVRDVDVDVVNIIKVTTGDEDDIVNQCTMG